MSDSRIVGELSGRGLSNIKTKDYDFAFIVDGAEIPCSRFQAQFLSPTVSDLLHADSSIDRFEIELQNKSVIVPILSQLLETGSFEVPASQFSIITRLNRILGNSELQKLLFKGPNDETSALERLRQCPVEGDIAFIASHFSSASAQPALQTLGIELLSAILGHPDFKVDDEDSVFHFIESLSLADDSFRDLVEHVEAQYLSKSCIAQYIAFLDPNRLSGETWNSICRRLSLPVSPTESSSRLNAGCIHFSGEGSGRFRGIFHHIRKQCNQNPHVAGKVIVTDSGHTGTLQTHDLIFLGNKKSQHWGTDTSRTNHFIAFEFTDCRVLPTGYALKAHNSSWSTAHFIQSWQFQGSNDQKTWDLLDRQERTNEITGNDKEAYFALAKKPALGYRYLRIFTDAVNTSGNHQFGLQQIEIFGDIVK
jgi:hypothetical protein